MYLCLDVPPNLNAIVKADKMVLTQVMMNLINNAQKFTKDGFVMISVKECDNVPGDKTSFGDEVLRFVFEIKDTGVGIPSEKLGSIFDRFTQVDSSTSRKFGGTGLGLTICKNLIQLMDGDISVSSEEGKGST